jgi:hypothetical protein
MALTVKPAETQEPDYKQMFLELSAKLDKMMGNKPEAPAAPSVPNGMVALELAIYKRYTRAGKLYTDEQYYLFTTEQAEVLLQELEDHTGRPLWKRYRPKKTERQIEHEAGRKVAFDASKDGVRPMSRDAEELEAMNRGVIEIGEESELSDIPGLLNDDSVEI